MKGKVMKKQNNLSVQKLKNVQLSEKISTRIV